DFDGWVAKVKSGSDTLGREAYLTLEKPSQREPVRYYASTEAGLYHRILNLCVTPGKMCMDEMMAIDARGGLGRAGIANVAHLA
ncbi:COX aromatic rich motif-containing protein, partial [Escherichia coli]|uniref:COX aromatic rich motif-containing protein n=1 Tax=Escherichia coli TaxID=562 RepID=UPI0039E08CEF